ncbi:hypothetical protein [Streptomyces subrutilus]|uniref:hypothetical protein n=1 Tax=Streptomyces subrutilus TaxID=36818 RepID=UPI0033D1E0A1
MHVDDVTAHAGMPAVLAGEGREDVDVVVRVTDRDPPAGLLVAVFGDARGVHHAGCYLRPLGVRQAAVTGRVADRDVPHVLIRLRTAQPFHGRVQEQRQIRQHHAFRSAGRARQIPIPGGDEVGIDVLVPVARTEEVVKEVDRRRTCLRLLRHHDHGRLSRIT